MLLLVGLGNPGRAHARHRHNIGYMALDAIARAQGFGRFKARARLAGELAEGRLADAPALLLKPTTYMNESGRAVGAAMRFYKLAPDAIVVFHDDLDLAPGKLRVKIDGSNAGHHGLDSIDAHIGKAYRRARLGIGHPGDRDLVTPYVLSNFFADDAEWLEPLLDAVGAAAPLLAGAGDDAFMTRVALLARAPAGGGGEGVDGA